MRNVVPDEGDAHPAGCQRRGLARAPVPKDPGDAHVPKQAEVILSQVCSQGSCPQAGECDLVPKEAGDVPNRGDSCPQGGESVFLSRQRAPCPQGARRFPYPQESRAGPCLQGDVHVPELAEMLLSPGRFSRILSPGREKRSGPQGSRGCPCSQAGWQ